MHRLIVLLVMMAALVTTSAAATPGDKLRLQDVPPSLQSWVPWVLQDELERECLQFPNANRWRRCVWAGTLTLKVDVASGEFDVPLVAYAESWVALPGGEGQWPQAVEVDGTAAVVVENAGQPMIKLAAGRHHLRGRYVWPALPDSLRVPTAFGLVSLTLGGVVQAQANLGGDGQLWLKARGADTAESDRLDVRVFRQLVDDLPMQVVTALELDVAGTQREITLQGALLADSVPMQLESPLPARLEEDGSLRLQLRPGHWRVRLTSRHLGAVTKLALPASVPPWPADEVWVFAARTSLRLVELDGAAAIDPRQTTLPDDWQGLPAYRLTAADSLNFDVKRRGDPEPEPDQLHLARQLWLDFDGRGYTVQDQLGGQMTQHWRLEADTALELGRVLLNGEPQFITTVTTAGDDPGRGRRGVEVRRGALDLSADSRYSGPIDELPAVGWAHDVNSLSATLHLPPGWRLWAARGVDNLPDTWLQRWTLLDLFLVLMATVAVARLLSRRWALLVLLTLTLIWHEPQAPRQVWLHLLAALALLRVLPPGRLHWVVASYRNVTLAVLAVTALVFMIEQVRVGLYPQLEQTYAQIGQREQLSMAQQAPTPMVSDMAGTVAEQSVAGADAMLERSAVLDAEEGAEPPGRSKKSYASSLPYGSMPQHEIDPRANIQTGPGLPDWQWKTISLGWNGPVAQDQTIKLVLLSPSVNLLLALLRVLLLGALLVLFMRASMADNRGWLLRFRQIVPLLLVVSGSLLVGLAAPPVQAALPDNALLDELRQRLLRPPSCLPQCAAIGRLRAILTDNNLTLEFDAHVAATVAVPLPGHRDQWTPRTVLLDGRATAETYRDEGGVLWLALNAGVHRITLAGGVPEGASFQLPFPLVPRLVEATLSGWAVNGLRPDGGSEPQWIFTRLAESTSATRNTLEPRTLPAFFTVARTLRLGLDWRAETTVSRLTPADSAAALAIPLLPGESVTTADVRVDSGRVMVNMAADASTYSWESVLEKTRPLTLTAPVTSDWTETWRADISPWWHAELSGIAVVHHQDDSGQWLPTWQPWAGETVTLDLTRPVGVAGQSLTIDHSNLRVQPAERATAAALDFTARSSQGGQHTLILPLDATLQSIAVNGVPQPIRQEGQRVTIPLVPGQQQFHLLWHSEVGITTRYSTPALSLGTSSVNASLHIDLPQDRWTLLAGGPRLGPAVLFWGVLIVLFAVAVVLGRTRLTPLTTVQWLLLAIGLSQVDILHALVVVAWLFALTWRGRSPLPEGRHTFNALQVMLAVLTVTALALLFAAIKQGLLGQPDMQIAGNGSSATSLNWFQDRIDDDYPVAWVISVSLWFYRGLMLLWALWLAFALLNWLRWGWTCYTRDGLWRSAPAVVPAVAVDAAGSETPPAL